MAGEQHNATQEPERTEQEKAPRKKILKISEMALFVDGRYVGEIGNPTYKGAKNMFEYHPESGILVSGNRETILLATDDLARIPHVLGHVTIKRLLGDEPRQLSDREFEGKLYELYDSFKNKIHKITFLGRLFGIEWDDDKTDFCINRVAAKNPHFSPEELMDAILDELKNEHEWQHQNGKEKNNELAQTIEGLKRTGALDIDPRKNRDWVINYFYFYCRLQGIDISSPDAIYNDGFKNFIFLEELLEEYERQPDIRFGDALLVACSRQQQEWDKKANSEQEQE